MKHHALLLAALVAPALVLPARAADEKPVPAGPRPADVVPGIPDAPPSPASDPEMRALRDQLGRLQAEAQLRQLKLQAELAPLQEKAARDQARKMADAADNDQAKDALARQQAEAQIRQLKLQAELAPLTDAVAKVKAQLDAEQAKRQAERAARLAASETADFELQMKLAEQERSNKAMKAEMERLAAELALAEARFKAENLNNNLEVARRKQQVGLEQSRRDLDRTVAAPMVYADQPFQDGVLTITDRRVPFNGPVTGASVDEAIERLNFFANQSDKPVFLVIDASPGGSVAAGMKLIEAMRASRAPVHVVVKVFAASMAATICTLAEHSYALPNAIILHHQLSYSLGAGPAGGGANLTQHREQLKQSSEWYRRIAEPVAAKMGLTLEQYVAEMYKHNSDGDWSEFADGAQKLKWVQNVPKSVKELGVREQPGAVAVEAGVPPVRRAPAGCALRTDDQGREYVQLPRLESYDCWDIHNPDGFYRVP